MESNVELVHFVSLGCPKNLVDTEIMLGSLKGRGYEVTDSPELAKTIVVNTCGFIESAKQESISKIMEMADFKTDGQLENLVVAGCLTQRYKEELVEGLPEVDLFVGSGHFQEIHEILEKRKRGSQDRRYFDSKTFLQQSHSARINSEPFYRAYLKISEGCKKSCSFCAIPLIRGGLQSRRISDIVNEAKLLVAGGVRELTVVSHDFSDYGWDIRKSSKDISDDGVELLKRLAEESGAKWIRVLYMYPDGMSDELFDVMATHDNLIKYFDMPLQHISNPVLKRMNRRMVRADIEARIHNIRERFSDAVIRTQFIVGFPGETEENFQELLNFIQDQKFERVGCFKYSIEEDTRAAKLDQQVPEEVKEERYHRLMSLQKTLSQETLNQSIGKIFEVVVDGPSEETPLLLSARTAQQAPEIDGLVYINDGTAKAGDVVKVLITDSHEYDLVGEII